LSTYKSNFASPGARSGARCFNFRELVGLSGEISLPPRSLIFSSLEYFRLPSPILGRWILFFLPFMSRIRVFFCFQHEFFCSSRFFSPSLLSHVLARLWRANDLFSSTCLFRRPEHFHLALGRPYQVGTYAFTPLDLTMLSLIPFFREAPVYPSARVAYPPFRCIVRALVGPTIRPQDPRPVAVFVPPVCAFSL